MTAPVLLFDGDCAFCTASARFIQRRIPTPASVLAWQSVDLRRFGLTGAECAQAIQWITVDTAGTVRVAAGPAAAAELLRSSGRGWRWVGRLLGTRPVVALAWPIYRWIARNRHRLPGGTASCAVNRHST